MYTFNVDKYNVGKVKQHEPMWAITSACIAGCFYFMYCVSIELFNINRTIEEVSTKILG